MSLKRFEDCYRLVRIEEGGWSDRKNDRGGKTMSGVTQKRFDEFNLARGIDLRPVNSITEEEVRTIYLEAWTAAGCDKLPANPPLDLFVFDVAINSGPAKAIVLMQRALKMDERHHTGYFGPITTKALELADLNELAAQYLRERVKFYRNLVKADATQADHINGWMNRVKHMAAHAGMNGSDFA